MSHTIFLIIAFVTTGIFAIQFVLSIFFGDMDADVDVDADISSVVSFQRTYSLRNRIRLVYVSGREHGYYELWDWDSGRFVLYVCRVVSL